VEIDKKYQGRFEMLCRRRMERIIWTDRVESEVLHRAKRKGILHIQQKGARLVGLVKSRVVTDF
jgi:hypothetical protein